MYDELRRVASMYMQRERSDHTLNATGLVHEAYLRLVNNDALPVDDELHFRALAARVMRQVLVDHARKHGASKRGGDRLKLTLAEAADISDATQIDILGLEAALAELSKLDERKGRVVELLFFGGLTHKQAAEILGISHKTVEADWYMARAWLGQKLRDGETA